MKTNLSDEILLKIKELYYQNIGSRKIASIIGINRSTVQRVYKQLNLDSANKKQNKYAYKAVERICKICNINKPIAEYRKRIKNNRVSSETYCLNCEKINNKNRCKNRYLKHKNLYKIYNLKNKEKIRIYQKQYLKIYRKNKASKDVNFKLRYLISCTIFRTLKSRSSSKNKQSCLKYLPFTIEELKNYLESKFEPWMNWNNWGMYKISAWNDDDVSTWKWQIDHIIPHSEFKYISMQDIEFKKCWSLSNLRPYSAKQNVLDGITKKRHASKNIIK